uniref:Uncharacterized protein n=1 Tax=viral metagenome TaxID=1070528 RepID=A0A6M3KZW8_9ZZZZ
MKGGKEMSWTILKNQNENYVTGISWYVVWEDDNGIIYLAECAIEEDAKIIAKVLTKLTIVPDTIKVRSGWKEADKC